MIKMFIKITRGKYVLKRGSSKKGQTTYVVFKGRSFKGTFPPELEGKRVRIILEVLDE